jgi:hypothetical protein
MGVHSLAADEWLQIDDLRDLDLLEKDLLRLRHPGRTFVALPGSEMAGGEVASLVESALARHGHRLRRNGVHPLDTAALGVQEDLCLLERAVENESARWILTAGSVCFPTRWDLPSKLGCSLAEIHAPVPRYAEQLSLQVDRFFDRMLPGSLAARLNWSLVGEKTRRLEPRDRQAPTVLPADPGRELFLRIERQTLRRLADHDAVAFGIRVHVWPLGQVAAELPPEAFADMLCSIPVDVARYKDLEELRAGLVAWLRSRSV